MTVVTGYRTSGPIPKFTNYHIWKTLMILDIKNSVSRKKLSQKLDIGEGSTRTILNILKNQEYIQVARNGVTLTKNGSHFKKTVQFDVTYTLIPEITIDAYDCAIRIPFAAKKITYGYEERDVAIKAGASGATTLICKNGELIFPDSNYSVSSAVTKTLREKFAINNDDVIIIGTANTPEKAECGAVTAALNVINNFNINRNLNDIVLLNNSTTELTSLAFAVYNLIGGYPVCAKSRDNLGIRIENGIIIDNAYTGEILEETIEKNIIVRRIAVTGPYKGAKVISVPINVKGKTIAAIGVANVIGIDESNLLTTIFKS
ncbi:MAG: DUF2111 domain-containing protein [archaeon]|nr:DUF2111 domain-containing protein [archaeon]